jgi:phosphoribosylformimino-5-aminoimidazole carboxamide ribotide isomerase
LRIIPVIDLMAGQVVRGIAGRREEYRPIITSLAADSSPSSIARAFVERFGLRECYLADLDAIGGAEPAWEIYSELTNLGLDLSVDAGISDRRRAAALAAYRGAKPLAGIVVGLESAPGPESLEDICRAVGGDRLIFSLDLKDGRPLGRVAAWLSMPAEEIATAAIELGVGRLIVLDLSRVGTSGGTGSEELCRSLRRRYPHIELIAGGGVRGPQDLRSLAAAGCDAALVATALHDGRITAEDVSKISNLESEVSNLRSQFAGLQNSDLYPLSMPKRVLDVGQCVPDHAAIRRLVERQFGAQVVQAHGPDDTLAALRSGPFDLVLINRKLDADYSDGIDILRTIKSDPELSAVPVMLITNYPEHQRAAMAAGAEEGFGKAQLADPATHDKLRKFLEES